MQNYHSQPPRRRLNRWMVLTLGLAVLLLVVGVLSFLWQQSAPAQGNSPMTGNTGSGTPTPTPTPDPTLTQHQKFRELAAQYVSKMSLDDMIAQLIFVDDVDDGNPTDMDYMVKTQHIGGVLMYKAALVTKEAVQENVTRWNEGLTIPLFVATEDEGQYVNRLGFIYPTHPTAWSLAQKGDPTAVSADATLMAQQLKELKLNTTFTPVSEVAELEDGYLDWNERSFGRTVDTVTKYAGTYLTALQKEGIIGTLKHFPGTGRIPKDQDPHLVLPTVDASRDDFYNVDMAPFKQLIQSKDALEHPGFIMSTYVLVPSIDPDYPAQYSAKFIDGILRKEFGYDGVVITDALTEMVGNQINGQSLTPAEGAVAALQAGNDMLLGIVFSDQVKDIIASVKGAIDDGKLTQERIKESATRVLTLKLERNVVSASALQA